MTGTRKNAGPARQPKAPRQHGRRQLPTGSVVILRLVCARLTAAGIQPGSLLSKAGLSVEETRDANGRVDVRRQIKFLEMAAEALGDDCLGFDLAQDFDLREIGLVYYVMASCGTLYDAFRGAERYSRIVNEGIRLHLKRNSAVTFGFAYVNVDRNSDRHQVEFWLTTLIRLCRQLTGVHLVPQKVRVRHFRGQVPARCRAVLGCNVEFGAKVDEVIFNRQSAQLPITSADPYLNRLLTRYAEEGLALASMGPASMRLAVENEITLLLPHGKAKAPEVARRLGVSRRTLARVLSAEGTTFSRILSDLRSDLAAHHLRNGELSISQIAWLLGYGEVSVFTHAFKRWHGKSPRQARAGLARSIRPRRRGDRTAALPD